MSKDKQIITNTENKSNNFEDKSNKQIADMADILCEAKGHNCAGGDDCRCIKQAEALYNAGYCKDSDVALKVIGEIEEGVKAAVASLQFENNPIHRKVRHETYSSLMRFIKTIEKKYTEEEK